MNLSVDTKIRCLSDIHFFDLMTPKATEDRTHSTKEQINTEELVRNCYEKFIKNNQKDFE